MMPRIARALALPALIAVCALAAAACAGKAESPAPSEEPATVAPSASPSPAASASAAACPTPATSDLGTLRRTAPGTAGAVLTDVRAAAQPCTDRVTFEFQGAVPSYDVRYEQSWTTCGKGDAVTTQGPAQLVVQFMGANAHDDAGQSTAAKSLTPALSSVKEAVQTCDFEADVAWVLGTEERYFTVTTLQNPTRVVVDVYH